MYQSLSFPDKITYTKVTGKKNTKELIIEPCFPGYGTTIANALRRVLISSLEGGSVIAVKIKDAPHEFATLQYVKEDILQIILNLKKVKFDIHAETDEPIKLTLKTSGEKVVTASEIEKNSDVTVSTPDAIIATLTDNAAEIEMELFVKKGMGYSPTETRPAEKLELGTIGVDAIFSPVLNVGFTVENVRVGEFTNYDKVKMDIETDGTVTPEEAVDKSAKIIMDHFNFLTKDGAPTPKEESATLKTDASTEINTEHLNKAGEVVSEEEAKAEVPEEKKEDAPDTKEKETEEKK